jgi:cyclomaltodextrinase
MFGRTLRIVAVLLLLLAVCRLPTQGTENQDSSSRLKKVTFTFEPEVSYSQVFLAGTFNGWSTDVTPMHRKGAGFEVTLFLPVGEYQYKFVADGQWITDQKAEKFHPDGFGGQNSVVVVDESFEDVSLARGDGRIMTEGLRHRQDAWERSLAPDGTVTLGLRTWMGDIEQAKLCWHATNDQSEPAPSWRDYQCSPMERVDSDGTYDYYQIQLEEAQFSYYFRLLDGDQTVILDGQGARPEPSGALNLFHLDTSELAAFATPDWVKQAVIYQIFPERFANGDSQNDPDFSEWYYEGLTELPPSGKTNGEYFHMVDDWYDIAGLKQSPYRTDGKPDWNCFYGGDIAGISQHLDYLEDLGITAIYLNPIFEAKSNHKYDAATYMQVDPHFASNQEFADFVAGCHSRGIHVILDLAFNHTGHTFWAFVDAREKGRQSQYWDWYEWKSWPVPGTKVWTPVNASDYYDCWWGFGQMPNLNFDLARPNSEEPPVVDRLDAQPNWPMVEHLLEATEFWLSQADVDGYRLDVASDVPFWFWELFRQRVKETKPGAYIVGELWEASPEYINGRYFDAAMNYKFFRDPVLAFIARGETSAQEFDRALAPGRLIYPKEGAQAMMNILGSHDTERFLTAAGGNTGRLKLAMLFGMTYVGAPTIYYGDEIAMTGGSDPDCRRPFYWKWSEESDRVELHDYVRSLIALRKEHPCLTRGSFEMLLADGKAYAYRRMLDQDQVVMVLNAGEADAMVQVPVSASTAALRDALGETEAPFLASEGVVQLTVPALSGYVLTLWQAGP